MTLNLCRAIRCLATALSAILLTTVLSGCLGPKVGRPLKRKGDEIVVAGQLFHTGTRVVTWMDPGGYDAYRVERRFAPFDESDWGHSESRSLQTPNRYGMRKNGLSDEQLEKIRGGGWDLPMLQNKVDQFVLHFDVAGISRNCFKTLQDARGLSVHFMLDLDGTIYQTLDLKERAWHATIANDRSIGIEIANMGSYGKEGDPLDKWYAKDTNGHTIITIPESCGPNPERTPNFVGKPARRNLIVGDVQGKELHQYDFTPQQYKALAKLTATLCTVFPKIKCDYPRDAQGKVITHKLASEDLRNYHGVLGHYHIQTDKVDPGPALQWDYVIGKARRLMNASDSQYTGPGEEETTDAKLIKDN